MNEIPKVVFSRALDRADRPESRIARGDLGGEVKRLQAEAGGDIIGYGGASFARSLVRSGLVDEYRLTIHPLALGSRKPGGPASAQRVADQALEVLDQVLAGEQEPPFFETARACSALC